MLCPYCNSMKLVHDFDYGYIVCAECGTVIDTIFLEFYEDHLEEIKYEVTGLPSIREGLEKKKSRLRRAKIAKMYADIRIYEKYAKRARKNVYVDVEAAIKHEQGEVTSRRIYRHKADEEVTKILDTDPDVRYIIENIIDKDPILSSRTHRGKVALALILRDLLEGRNDVDIGSICRKTLLTPVHVKRLTNLLNKRFNVILVSALSVKGKNSEYMGGVDSRHLNRIKVADF